MMNITNHDDDVEKNFNQEKNQADMSQLEFQASQ